LFGIINVEEILEHELNKAVGALTIPDDLAVPDAPSVAQGNLSATQSKVLAAASLLGQWHEGKKADQDIARRLVDEF